MVLVILWVLLSKPGIDSALPEKEQDMFSRICLSL